MGRDAHIGESQVLDRETSRLQTTNEREAAAVVDVQAELLQLPAKAGELKVVIADL